MPNFLRIFSTSTFRTRAKIIVSHTINCYFDGKLL